METSSNTQQDNTISDSDTKLFKLNSTGNWDDVGTGKATITRSTSEIESIDIFLTMITQPKEKENESTEGQKPIEEEQSFVFQGITSFSIQSGSILVFMSREKRFALSFKDSDTAFSQFFYSQIKSSYKNMVQQAQPQSLITSMCTEDNNLIEGIKDSFYKYQQQDNQVSLGEIFRAFRRLLNECKEDFIKVMFTDQHIQFLFAVLQYSYHNSSKVSYRTIIKNLSYVNMLELPPNIEKHAKFNMYLAQFKDIGSLVIQPGLESLMTLFSFQNATVIINYILQNPSILRNKLKNIQQNIPHTIKLLAQLMNLSNSASLETKNKLFSSLISENGGALYSKLANCLTHSIVIEEVISNKPQITIFQQIIEIYVAISSINIFSFENFICENNLQNQNSQKSQFCESLVFGFINGNVNLKSHILELLSNVFNPQGTKSRWKIQPSENEIVSHSIYRLIQRKILSPICKQLFRNRSSYTGQQLMIQWISKLFPHFSIILRRVIIDSGIMKKALIHGHKKTIILLLVLKLLKGLLHIKASNYTIQYLKRSGVISSLNQAYLLNKSKNNIIASLFKSIQQDIKQFQGDSNNSRQLQKVFQKQYPYYQ